MLHATEIYDRFLCKFRICAHKTIGKLIQMHISWKHSPHVVSLIPGMNFYNVSHREFHCTLRNILLLSMKYDPKRHIIVLWETTRLSSALELYFQISPNYLRQQNDNVQNIDYIVTSSAEKAHFVVNVLVFLALTEIAAKSNNENNFLNKSIRIRLHHLVRHSGYCSCRYRKCWQKFCFNYSVSMGLCCLHFTYLRKAHINVPQYNRNEKRCLFSCINSTDLLKR